MNYNIKWVEKNIKATDICRGTGYFCWDKYSQYCKNEQYEWCISNINDVFRMCILAEKHYTTHFFEVVAKK